MPSRKHSNETTVTQHFEFLVEEPSMEKFLHGLLPRLLRKDQTFKVHPFQGKQDLLKKLESRLRAYAEWLPTNWRIVVLVDRDDDDCKKLKQELENIATKAGLKTRSNSSLCWQVVNRIVIEELEAWYFGDWDAVRAAYPKVSRTVMQKTKYRNSDAIAGGTWETFESVMQRYGYFKSGLRKIEVAQALGQHLNPSRCKSPSFVCFRDALL
ncbi:DUF4276 family protein [Thermosynechococcus sichuanensis E542]|uniref:DUF4276 family protein n=1 Tax=Thermosynechococcus sichuanensis E542 TaxID=2016101 RepID=A0A3B7MNH3_9CYAN|nr:DUF4276 family protein [Thermosynechococcus vestitus E542]